MQNPTATQVWISRPAQGGQNREMILPLDWEAITKRADTKSNYQLMPGDRLFIARK